jgi:FixJ family two-component response regulator/DNA-binding MarR family transcriptional regulator
MVIGTSIRSVPATGGVLAANPVVLVVDDDQDAVDEIADLVQGAGYPVRKANNPGTVMRTVVDEPDIAIVLLDLRMPRIDGITLASRIAQQLETSHPLRFVFMSGHATLADAVSAMRLDAVDLLLKPIGRQDLARALARAAGEVSKRRNEMSRNAELMRSVEAVASHAIKLANELSSNAQGAVYRSRGPVFTPKAVDRGRGALLPAPAVSSSGPVAPREPGHGDEILTANDRSEFLRHRIAALIKARQARGAYFDRALFSDPCWDMLLDLMHARLSGKDVAVSSLCIASGVPQTTGLRRIEDLMSAGLLVRREDPKDRRRVFVELSDDAVQRLKQYLDEMGTLE